MLVFIRFYFCVSVADADTLTLLLLRIVYSFFVFHFSTAICARLISFLNKRNRIETLPHFKINVFLTETPKMSRKL